MGFPFICTGIDLLVISLGDYYLQKMLESFWICAIMWEVLSSCHIASWYFCVFLCPDCESPDYLRATRPWRTVSELNRFLLWFFPLGLFFQASGLSTRILVGTDTHQINTYFFEFLLCTLNCAKFNQGLHTHTQPPLVLILKNFITYLGREIIDMCVLSKM